MKGGSKTPRQKQLSIALQRINSNKPRLLQLSTDLSSSGLPGVQFPLGIIKHLLLRCIHVQIFEVHTVIVIRACTTWGHIITHFWPTMTSVVMVLNIYFRSVSCKCPEDNPDLVTTQTWWQHLLQICILQVPRRQPRPGDSVMGRRVAFQCDVDVLMMVLHESNPVFPLILPRYLMAIIFTAFDLAAYI